MTQSWLEVKLTTLEAKAVLANEGLYGAQLKRNVALVKSKNPTFTEALVAVKEGMSDAVIKLYSKHENRMVLDANQKTVIPLRVTGIYSPTEIDVLRRTLFMRNRSGVQLTAGHNPFSLAVPPVEELIHRSKWVRVKTQGYAHTPAIPLHSRNG